MGGQRQEDTAMSFWDHLEVMRWAIIRVLCVFCVLFAALLWAMPHIFTDFILGPTSGSFCVYRWISALSGGVVGVAENFHVQIININVASQFLAHINTSMSLALVLTAPYIACELWLFVRPALYAQESRHAKAALAFGTVMFYLGCATGYLLVFPFTFRFLVDYEISQEIQNQISLQSYISYFTTLILVMGVVFEMPLVAWALGKAGLLRKSLLQRHRSHAAVVLLVMAAFITPSGDPFTMLLVFAPLYLLYELSVFVIRK